MTPQEQYWKNRCEAAENFILNTQIIEAVKVNGNDGERRRLDKWNVLYHTEPPAPAQEVEDLPGWIWGSKKPMYAFSDDGLSNMLDDVLIEMLKINGHSTGSEEDVDKLYDEKKIRKDAIMDIINAGSRWQQGQGELEALHRWKAEAMEVFNQLDLQEIGNELGITLGHSIADKILPYIKELKARKNAACWVSEVACRFAEWVSWNYSRAEGQQDVWIAEFGFDDSDKLTTDLWKQFEIGNTFKEISEKHGSPYLPTREQAQEWAGQFADKVAFRVPYNGSNYFNDDNHHKWASEAALAMYDWVAAQLNPTK